MKKNKGFTILELLVVVAIIAILAIIAIPNFIGRIDQAKDSRELAEIDAVTKAVAIYYAENGVYPTLQGKDGTLLQPQPIDGSPHNIDFSYLVPAYLDSLPHFSYWWVDHTGEVYHTQKALGSVSAGVFTPTAGYTYTVYKVDGSTQVLSAPYTLQVGEYVKGEDDQGNDLPKVSAVFKNAKMHPEDPEYVAPVTFTTQRFDYTGSVQSFTVPATGTYKIEAVGSSAAVGHTAADAGKGGYAYGEKRFTAGEILYVYVGGTTGYNGGKNRGGGATDFRLVGGLWDAASGLSSRILVAGGGGAGFSHHSSWGGDGGGLVGNNGTGTAAANGGTQTSGGSGYTSGTFGIGGAGQLNGNQAGGGGGGWYGGGGASAPGYNIGSGGGGSSYIGTLSNSGTTTGGNTGHGYAKITYVGP